MIEWIKLIRAHALANYNKGGWDYVVEAYDDADIMEDIGSATTYGEALKNLSKILRTRDAYRRDIQGA